MDGNTLIVAGLALAVGGGIPAAALSAGRIPARGALRIALACLAWTATGAGLVAGTTGMAQNRQNARDDVAALCRELQIKSERAQETCLRLVARNLP